MMKRIFSLLLTITLFWVSPALADETKEVTSIMNKKVDEVVSILKTAKFSKEEKDKRILTVLEPIFDFSQMAKLALGKKHWDGMNEQQQKEFSFHFIRRLQDSYLEKMNLYTDEKVVYKDTLLEDRKISYHTELVSKDDKIAMEYRLYKGKDGWKVYDVKIMGVSVVQTYRNQFESVLQSGDYNALIESLKKPKA